MADEKINWQIEIDGKAALKTLDDVKASAKEVDLGSKTIGNLKLMVADLLATHRAASQVADAVKMERRERQDNLRIAERQKQVEKDRADTAAKAAKTERENALSGLRNVAIGSGLGALAMVKGMAGSGFSDTLQGQQADVYGQLLNRQVASIFAPLLEEKTKYVSQMTQWLQGLDGPQRESIRAMTMFAGSLGALGFIMPKVTKGIAAAAIGFLPSKLADGKFGSFVTGAAGPLGIGLALMTSVLMSSEKGRESLANLAKAFEPLIPAFANVIDELTPPIAQLANSTARLVAWLDKNAPEGTLRTAVFGPGPFLVNLGRSIASQITGRPLVNATWSAIGGGNNLSPIPNGFEDIGRDYERIFEAATKMDLQQKQVELLEKIEQNTGKPLVFQPPPQLQGAVGLNNLIGF